jgi:hypothetical protein
MRICWQSLSNKKVILREKENKYIDKTYISQQRRRTKEPGWVKQLKQQLLFAEHLAWMTCLVASRPMAQLANP